MRESALRSARIEWRVWYVTARRASEGERREDRAARRRHGGTTTEQQEARGGRGDAVRRWSKKRELPERPRERMRRFRYRPAAGRVSRARSLLLPLLARHVSPSRAYAHAVGPSAFLVGLSLSLSRRCAPPPAARAARARASLAHSFRLLSLPPPLPLIARPVSLPRPAGAAALAPYSPAPSLFFSLIRSRRSRLPSSSRRSESNRL